MEREIEHLLKEYQALEKVCTLNDSEWNSCHEFSSAFTHFSVKITQLRMFAYNQTIMLDPALVNNKRSVVINPAQLNANMQLLAMEINDIINHMRAILTKECTEKTGFIDEFKKAIEAIIS